MCFIYNKMHIYLKVDIFGATGLGSSADLNHFTPGDSMIGSFAEDFISSFVEPALKYKIPWVSYSIKTL